MRTTLAATLTAAALTAGLTVGLAGTAHADRYGVDDGPDTGHGSDITALQVRHTHRDVVVTTDHVDLRRDSSTGSRLRVYVDTDRRDPGPEYVLVADLTRSFAFHLLHTDGFGRDRWGDPVSQGDYLVRLDDRHDRVTTRIQRAGIGEPDAVRVGVRASGTRTDGTRNGLVDWVGPQRWMTPWIGSGSR